MREVAKSKILHLYICPYYLLSELCEDNSDTYTYATACAVDPAAFGTPTAGYLNICPEVSTSVAMSFYCAS